ncbi:MAG: hypothetical protein ABEL51_13885 [Salinibacter sp.]
MAEPRKTLTIYIPDRDKYEGLQERLRSLAEAQDRSVNYLAVQAILEYLQREEE